MARKVYRSMQGRVIDMDLLTKANELTPAIGNAKMNARGDELGPGGKIIRKREELVSEYYDKVHSVKDEQFKRGSSPETNVVENTAESKESKKTVSKKEVKNEDKTNT